MKNESTETIYNYDPDEYREESDREYDPVKRTVAYDYTELTALEEYLEQMEKQGLRLREFDKYTFYFEKCEPRTVRYSCVVFKDENRPDGLNKEFVELCRGAGWKLAAYDKRRDELYIFRSEDENAEPIMTDDNQTLSFAARKNIKRNICDAIILPLIYIFNIMDRAFTNFNLEKTWFLSDESIMSIGICLLWVVIIIISVTMFLSWYIKQKRRIKSGEPIEFFNIRQAEKRHGIESLCYPAFWLAMLVVLMFCDSGFFTQVKRIFYYTFCFIIIFIFFCRLISRNYYAVDYRKTRIKRHLLRLAAACVCAAVAVGCVKIGESLSVSAKEKMLADDRITVSLSDLGCDVAYVEDELEIDATRFCQKYSIISECTNDNCDNEERYLTYNIIVCDYPSILNRYIAYALTDDIDESPVKLTPPDTKWDELYYYVYKSEETGETISYRGVAVKGNTAVCAERPIYDSEERFFGLIYQRLFES